MKNILSKKEKVKAGFIFLGIALLFVSVLILRYGDVNLTGSLIEFAAETEVLFPGVEEETVRSDSSFMGRYANRVYHLIFSVFLIYGFLGRKNLKKRKYLNLALIYISVQVISTFLITEGVKRVVGRPRPEVAMEEGYRLKPFSGRTGYQSFPSGHASDAFSSAGVIWMFSPSPVIGGVAVAYSSFISLSRVTRGRHHVSDVAAGMAAGFSVGLILMYKKYKGDEGQS